MDFDLAKKHGKEGEARRREAKRKLDQQRKDEEVQRIMEEGMREREEQRIAQEKEERRRAEEEAALNDGIRVLMRLRPYPTARADDKLILPPSVLEMLERQGALDGGVMTFTVALPSGPAQSAGGLTHAGVAEFVAEEGTVGVPPRVALCLTKGGGLDSLAAAGTVEVRYTRLNRSAKSTVRLQPRGEGFHAGGKDAIRMDLEHILLETLRGHTALTVGDWLPIRHNGITYELVVRELLPQPQLLLIDTDLTVEVLPSEQTEEEQRAEEERTAREEAAAREAEEKERARILRAQQKALALPPEPEAGGDAVQILVRLPEGGRLQRRFARSGPLQHLLDWVESEQQTMVVTGQFALVQKWPGHMREFRPAEAAQTLGALGFARQEALFLQRAGEAEIEATPDVPEAASNTAAAPADDGRPRPEGLVEYWKTPPAAAPISHVAAGDTAAWATAGERANESLDRRIEGEDTPTNAVRAEPELKDLQGQELVGVFERLVAFGMRPEEAAQAAKKYSAQLQELGGMGFHDWPEAVKQLDKYQGRLLRVANALAEKMEESGGDFQLQTPAVSSTAVAAAVAAHFPGAQAPAAAQSVPQPPPAATSAPKAVVDKAAVTAKFQELVKSGMDPNEAATQAIKLVRAEVARAVSQPPVPEASAPDSLAAPANFVDQMTELATMGFVDEARNEAMLRKYAGRMDRVVEALCSG
jgi:ubiquitin fusion degradation protein 1